jgi:hypothetical protein
MVREKFGLYRSNNTKENNASSCSVSRTRSYRAECPNQWSLMYLVLGGTGIDLGPKTGYSVLFNSLLRFN